MRRPAPAPGERKGPPLWKKAWREADKPPAAAEAWALAHYRQMFSELSDRQALGACRYDMRRAFWDERWMREQDEKEGRPPDDEPLAARQADQIIVQMIKRFRRQTAEAELADPTAAARRDREMWAEQKRRRAAARHAA